jgi:NitT/TauT family transport system permease protein
VIFAIMLTAVFIVAGTAARLLLAVPDSAAFPALLAGAATCAAVAAMTGLSRNESNAARIAVPKLFGALLLWLWEMLVVAFGVPRVILPPPSDVAVTFFTHLDILGVDFRQTVLRSVLPGYAIGCGSGFLTALAIERSDFLKRGLMPLGNLVSAMPIVGIAPIMVMWFGFDWPSKAAVVTVMTFFPMLVNTIAGLNEAGAMERDLMHCYAAGPWTTLLKLRLPAAMPFVFNALKLNSTLALIGAVVAEFFGTPIVGMGFRISTEAARMNLDVVWATIAVTALTGSLSFAAIAGLERVVTFWHPSFRAR